MVYSVWDHGNRIYRYYQTRDQDPATHSPKPSHLKSSRLGLSPDQAAWPLPPRARLVGKGKQPVGQIASKGGSALGILPVDLSVSNVFILGLIGLVAYHFLWKPSRRRR